MGTGKKNEKKFRYIYSPFPVPPGVHNIQVYAHTHTHSRDKRPYLTDALFTGVGIPAAGRAHSHSRGAAPHATPPKDLGHCARRPDL